MGISLQAFQKIRQRLRHERLSLARQESLSELWAERRGPARFWPGPWRGWCCGRFTAWSRWAISHFSTRRTIKDYGLSRTLLDNLGKLYENSLFLGNLFEFLDLKPQIASRPHARLPAFVSEFRHQV